MSRNINSYSKRIFRNKQKAIHNKYKTDMGTRSLVIAIKNKEVKLAQYGQFDGYPEG